MNCAIRTNRSPQYAPGAQSGSPADHDHGSLAEPASFQPVAGVEVVGASSPDPLGEDSQVTLARALSGLYPLSHPPCGMKALPSSSSSPPVPEEHHDDRFHSPARRRPRPGPSSGMAGSPHPRRAGRNRWFRFGLDLRSPALPVPRRHQNPGRAGLARPARLPNAGPR